MLEVRVKFTTDDLSIDDSDQTGKTLFAVLSRDGITVRKRIGIHIHELAEDRQLFELRCALKWLRTRWIRKKNAEIKTRADAAGVDVGIEKRGPFRRDGWSYEDSIDRLKKARADMAAAVKKRAKPPKS